MSGKVSNKSTENLALRLHDRIPTHRNFFANEKIGAYCYSINNFSFAHDFMLHLGIWVLALLLSLLNFASIQTTDAAATL